MPPCAECAAIKSRGENGICQACFVIVKEQTCQVCLANGQADCKCGGCPVGVNAGTVVTDLDVDNMGSTVDPFGGRKLTRNSSHPDAPPPQKGGYGQRWGERG